MTVVDRSGFKWKGLGWHVAPKSARAVMQVLGSIGVYSQGQKFAWRGMCSADFEVRSSLHRHLGHLVSEEQMREAEIASLTAARTWGFGVADNGHVDDLQLLADLQHFGVPTRLLDFSSNPMTALWFACQPAPETPNARGKRLSKSGLLLALNVTKWPKHMTVGDPYHPPSFGSIRGGLSATLEGALAGRGPFLVEQTNPNPRLRAQEGFFVSSAMPEHGLAREFTMNPFASLNIDVPHGDSEELERRLTAERGAGNPSNLPLVAVIINAGLKQRLLKYLENSYNRTARVLFPDYQGFVQYGLPNIQGA